MAEKTITYKLNFDASQLESELGSINKEMQDLTKTQKELRKNNKQNTDEFAKNAQQLKDTKKKYADVSKAITNVNRVRDKESGHLQKLKAQLSLVTRQIDKLNKEELENVKVGGKLIAKQKKLSDALSKTEKAGGNAHRDTGKYTDSLKELEGQFSKVSGSGGKFGDMLGGAGGKVGGFVKKLGVLGIAIGAIIAGFVKANAIILKFAKQTTQVAYGLGVTRQEAVGLSDDVRLLSNVWDVEFNDVVRSSKTLMYEYGISAEESLSIIEEGFIRGANVNGEFLELLKEYPAQLKTVGLSAKETIALITQTEQMGIFSDKGIDAIKEGGIRLREMTQSTKDALKGIEMSGDVIQSELASGEKSLFDVMKEVSKQMKKLPKDSDKVGTAIADIFGGPGEDAGIKFLSTLSDINLELTDLPNKMSNAEKMSIQLEESTTALGNSLREVFLSEDGTISSIINMSKLVWDDLLTHTKNVIDIIGGLDVPTPEQELADKIKDDELTNKWIKDTITAGQEGALSIALMNQRIGEMGRQIDDLKGKDIITKSDEKMIKEFELGVKSLTQSIKDYGKAKKDSNKTPLQLIKEKLMTEKYNKSLEETRLSIYQEELRAKLMYVVEYNKTAYDVEIEYANKSRNLKRKLAKSEYKINENELDKEVTSVRNQLGGLSGAMNKLTSVRFLDGFVGTDAERKTAVDKALKDVNEITAVIQSNKVGIDAGLIQNISNLTKQMGREIKASGNVAFSTLDSYNKKVNEFSTKLRKLNKDNEAQLANSLPYQKYIAKVKKIDNDYNKTKLDAQNKLGNLSISALKDELNNYIREHYEAVNKVDLKQTEEFKKLTEKYQVYYRSITKAVDEGRLSKAEANKKILDVDRKYISDSVKIYDKRYRETVDIVTKQKEMEINIIQTKFDKNLIGEREFTRQKEKIDFNYDQHFKKLNDKRTDFIKNSQKDRYNNKVATEENKYKLTVEYYKKEEALINQKLAIVKRGSQEELRLLSLRLWDEYQLKVQAMEKSNVWDKMNFKEQQKWMKMATEQYDKDLNDITYEFYSERRDFIFQFAQETLSFISELMDVFKQSEEDSFNAMIDNITLSADKIKNQLTTQYNKEKEMLANKLKNEEITLKQHYSRLALLDAKYEKNKHDNAVIESESLNKIKQQQFENNKKWQLAEIEMNAASAIIGTWAGYSPQAQYGAAMAIIQTAMIGALATAQSIRVSQTQYTPEPVKYGDGGLLKGPSHSQGGIRINSASIGEGDEYIVNKKSTSNNMVLLDAINQNKSVIVPTPIDYERLGDVLADKLNDKKVVLTESDLVNNEDDRSFVNISTTF